ncbi:hypothetical protein Hanom_Chr05g00402291 [Helianthus anomalus]
MAANNAAASTVKTPVSTAKPPEITPPRYGKSQASFDSLRQQREFIIIASRK